MPATEMSNVAEANQLLADLCAVLRRLPAPQRAAIAAAHARAVLRTLAPEPGHEAARPREEHRRRHEEPPRHHMPHPGAPEPREPVYSGLPA